MFILLSVTKYMIQFYQHSLDPGQKVPSLFHKHIEQIIYIVRILVLYKHLLHTVKLVAYKSQEGFCLEKCLLQNVEI